MEEFQKTDVLGNVWAIGVSRVYPGLYDIKCINKPQVKNPRILSGFFTGKDKAMVALTTHVEALQNKADEANKPLSKKSKEN